MPLVGAAGGAGGGADAPGTSGAGTPGAGGTGGGKLVPGPVGGAVAVAVGAAGGAVSPLVVRWRPPLPRLSFFPASAVGVGS
ncbi:MAG TPA: hypothetical protein VFQ80_00055, partial [Thermomicrobiales bacterium]|nr:hypothetical protein [Thermomicrobiales bacterium]